jgi:hypothetical protein
MMESAGSTAVLPRISKMATDVAHSLCPTGGNVDGFLQDLSVAEVPTSSTIPYLNIPITVTARPSVSKGKLPEQRRKWAVIFTIFLAG